LVDVKSLLLTLLRKELITKAKSDQVHEFFVQHSSAFDYDPKLQAKVLNVLKPRIPNAQAKTLLEIIWKKKTNLCLSADLEKWWEVIEAAEMLGPQICCVKTHVDALNFDSYEQVLEFRRKMLDLADKFGFLIMEDRKFADIGSTVHRQLSGKPFEINKWAHLVTAHGIPGSGILKCFSEFAHIGVVLIAEMSSEGNLSTKIPTYKSEVVRITRGYEEIVAGFVSQSRVEGADGDSSHSKHYFLQFTPGVNLTPIDDGLGQQYCSIEEAVFKREADVIIVGRGILQQPKEEWINTAEQYKSTAWNVWANRVLLLKDGK
jgi:orotidine 5'-phosphate decarboxylase subfamily 1